MSRHHDILFVGKDRHMEGRSKEEITGVTLLGNQGVSYQSDYAPEILETFVILPSQKYTTHSGFVYQSKPNVWY